MTMKCNLCCSIEDLEEIRKFEGVCAECNELVLDMYRSDLSEKQIRQSTYRDILVKGADGADANLYKLYEDRYDIKFPDDFKQLWSLNNGGVVDFRLCDEIPIEVLGYLDPQLKFRFKSWDRQICSIKDIVDYVPEFHQYQTRLKKKDWISKLIVVGYTPDELCFVCLDYRESCIPRVCSFSFRDCSADEEYVIFRECFQVW